jgi:RNA polymerase sigma-70 factor (ECF subfamily)
MTSPRTAERLPKGGPWDPTDSHSFAAQYGAAYSRLALVAASVVGDRDAAEDIVQDAAIIAFQKAEQFTPGTNFAAWLAEIVRRCALNHRRKTNGRRTYAADPAALARFDGARANGASVGEAGRPVASATGELLDDQSAFDDELVGALRQLSEEARCCLLLRTVEKLNYAEIATLLRIPQGTAMSHVHRSRATLRRLLSTTAVSDRGSNSST